MSEVKVNKISPRTACGTVTLGDSGDTFTIPSGATITNAGTATGFGATGAVNWDTTAVTSTPTTATSGTGYFINSTGGAKTINLPSGPSAGDIVGVKDYAGTANTNNITVGRNSSNIRGIASDFIITKNNAGATFIYVDGTKGWKVFADGSDSDVTTTYVTATGGAPCSGAISGDYKIHTFTGPGTFCVSDAGSACGSNTVDYLVVAGGGAGGGSAPGSACATGGAGAGGYRESVPSPAAWTGSPIAFAGNARPVTVQGYPIVVGGGGVGAPNTTGADGNTSTFSDIDSAGGGGGGMNPPGPGAGAVGGSGGGGSNGPSGAGDTPNVTPDQGTPGGTGAGAGQTFGGGGGGATVAGVNGSPTAAGAGGAGGTTCISASPTIYGGGGGGSTGYGGGPVQPCASRGAAGPGGGGQGANCGAGSAATINTGGGGGGGAGKTSGCVAGPGGSGGSGIVILRYKFQ